MGVASPDSEILLLSKTATDLPIYLPTDLSPDLPWFHRDYGNVTSNENLELRVCGDEGWGNEDSPIELYEIYVK